MAVVSRGTVLVTRPRAEAGNLVPLLAEKGWAALCEPLLDILPVKNPVPPRESYDGLAFTSARGVKAFAAVDDERQAPVYAVGPQTAEAARSAGFTNVHTGPGDATAMKDWLGSAAPGMKLLHPCGVHGRGELPAFRLPLYEAAAVKSLTPACRAALGENALAAALFFSPRTAEIFAQLLEKHGLNAHVSSIKALCISDTVVEFLRFLPWKDIKAASTPDRAGMLALLE